MENMEFFRLKVWAKVVFLFECHKMIIFLDVFKIEITGNIFLEIILWGL